MVHAEIISLFFTLVLLWLPNIKKSQWKISPCAIAWTAAIVTIIIWCHSFVHFLLASVAKLHEKTIKKAKKSTLLYTLSWAGWKQPVHLVACKIACIEQIIFLFFFWIRNTYAYSVLSRNVSKMRITSA